MAVCVQLATDGTLVPTGQPAAECSGYVLLTGAEHATLSFLQQLFQWPEPEVAATWLVGAFAFPLVCNTAGYLVGAVVKSVSTERA